MLFIFILTSGTFLRNGSKKQFMNDLKFLVYVYKGITNYADVVAS